MIDYNNLYLVTGSYFSPRSGKSPGGLSISNTILSILSANGLPLPNDCCNKGLAPTAGQVLAWDATALKYIPTSLTGGGAAANLAFVPGVSSGLISNTNGSGATIALATTTNAGFMSGAQVTQLSNAQPLLVSNTNIKTINGGTILGSGDISIAGGATNLTIGTASATTQPVSNSNGSGFILPIATSTTAGLLSATQQVQLTALPISGIQVINSVVGTGLSAAPLKLVGDIATPTANQYYGTNSSSAKSWYNLPSGGSGSLDKYNAGVGVFVSADGTGVTATKSAGVFTINVPSGVHCSFISVNVAGSDIQSAADTSGQTNWINIIINSANVGGGTGAYKLPTIDGGVVPTNTVSYIDPIAYNVQNQGFVNSGTSTVTWRKSNMVSSNAYVINITGV